MMIGRGRLLRTEMIDSADPPALHQQRRRRRKKVERRCPLP
jgi:hypothetical protein